MQKIERMNGMQKCSLFTVYVKNIIFSFTTEHNKLIIGDVTVLK